MPTDPTNREKLEAMLAEGIQSSGPLEMTPGDWVDMREALELYESREEAN